MVGVGSISPSCSIMVIAANFKVRCNMNLPQRPMTRGSKYQSLANQTDQEAFTLAVRFDAAPALDQSARF